MSVVRSLTFEMPNTGVQPAGYLYDITTPVPSGTLVLSSARVDIALTTPLDYASIPKSLSLEIGTVVGNSYVVDNDVSSNYFKVTLSMENRTTIGGVTYQTSLTYPNTSFRMNGDLQRQCVFRLHRPDGTVYEDDDTVNVLKYFCFHFTVVGPN